MLQKNCTKHGGLPCEMEAERETFMSFLSLGLAKARKNGF